MRGYSTGAMQDSGYGLPRIPLLGTPVNKGKRLSKGIPK
jgi:hypothetical protein